MVFQLSCLSVHIWLSCLPITIRAFCKGFQCRMDIEDSSRAILYHYEFIQFAQNFPTHGRFPPLVTFYGSRNFPSALFIYLFVCPLPVPIILKCKNIFDCGLWHVRSSSINVQSGQTRLQFPKPTALALENLICTSSINSQRWWVGLVAGRRSGIRAKWQPKLQEAGSFRW